MITIEKLNSEELASTLSKEQSLDPNAEYYLITFSSGKEITTKVTKKLKDDLELFGIIPETMTVEEKESKLQGYLVESAKKFVEQGLYLSKQDKNNKFQEGGIDDEF